MSQELTILTLTAASIGFFHTLLGPDHYLPFIALAQARKWSPARTGWITFLCGVGHVASSVVLGLIGVAAGIAVEKLKVTESVRGQIAAWLLIAFGLVYFVWGLRRAFRGRIHAHGHGHEPGDQHEPGRNGRKTATPWVLFLIFVFGPCEPLIPILMYPAARQSLLGVGVVTAVFAGVTISTMLGIVMLSTFGLARVPTERLCRYSHAMAGAIILMCGISIQFLGL